MKPEDALDDSVVREAAFALGEPAVSVAQVRPWVRYWARMLDLYLFCVALAFLAALNGVHVLGGAARGQATSFVALLGWVFTEAGLLASFGTTPGKALLRVRLVPPPNAGPHVPYGTALKRSLRVWWRGFGAGVPLVSFVTLVLAHRRLKGRGASSWDVDGGWRVEHGRIGAWRVLGVMCLFLVLLLLAGLVTAG